MASQHDCVGLLVPESAGPTVIVPVGTATVFVGPNVGYPDEWPEFGAATVAEVDMEAWRPATRSAGDRGKKVKAGRSCRSGPSDIVQAGSRITAEVTDVAWQAQLD